MEVANHEDGISTLADCNILELKKGWSILTVSMGLSLRRLRMSFIPSRFG
jgi:hypothetical protein